MRKRIERALAIIAIICSASRPAFAIPSPDLVVGSLLSVSQLLALGSAILGGGGAVYATARGRRYGWRVVSRGFVTGTVVLLVLFCGSLAFNIYQHLEQASERQARLEETLSRPSRTPGSLRGDPEVKELSYPQQMRHPNGMTTAEADTLLKTQKAGTQRDLIFLDVRERAEREMGTLPGATDMAKSGGGYNSGVVKHSQKGKQEPISPKGNVARVAQIGLSQQFKRTNHQRQRLSTLRSQRPHHAGPGAGKTYIPTG